jgi:hypothetical protein
MDCAAVWFDLSGLDRTFRAENRGSEEGERVRSYYRFMVSGFFFMGAVYWDTKLRDKSRGIK